MSTLCDWIMGCSLSLYTEPVQSLSAWLQPKVRCRGQQLPSILSAECRRVNGTCVPVNRQCNNPVSQFPVSKYDVQKSSKNLSGLLDVENG